MRFLAINGSPHKDGNTAILLTKVLDVAKREGHATEIYQLPSKDLQACVGCRQCGANKDQKCVLAGDYLNELVQKLKEADVIVLGSPVYVAGVTAQMKAFIDRAALVCRANGFLLKDKVGAGVVAARRGGVLPTVDTINHFFAIQQMHIAGSTYWNFGLGNAIGEVNSDKEGLANMENLGENLLKLAVALHPDKR